jgi:hypothetical protein
VLPDTAVILVIGLLTFICLLIFLVPVYLIRYHPRLDNDDITRLNNIMVVVLCLPFLAMAFLKLFFFLWSETGSSTEAAVSVAMMIVLIGIISAYSKLTGIKSDITLGIIAGMLFTLIWLITSDLKMAVVIVGTGLIILIIVFMYHKYTQNPVDLTSPLINYIVIGIVVIVAIILSSYYSHGSAYHYLGLLLFFLVYLLIGYGANWLSRRDENKE